MSNNEEQLMELAEIAVGTQNLDEFAQLVLPIIADMMHSDSVFLYIVDSRLPFRHFFQRGFQPEAASEIEKLCAGQFDQVSSQDSPSPVSVSALEALGMAADLVLYPLPAGETCVGLIGLTMQEGAAWTPPALSERLLSLMANTVSRLAEHMKSDQELIHLNTYLTVSSMLAQSLSLHELLEAALYCSMEAVSAEAASVLLLDDEKKNFLFYQVEGPAKPVLMTTTLPADKGIAGSVLQAQQSEVINDVPNDPRYYGKIDSESGFQTRNMIVIPLVAGEEQVGVLEVLNKVDGDSFKEDEHSILLSIAEEIAFAIRNAKVFEYLANTYCRQRQGLGSCKGCSRPLGSWTPCVKYREASI